MSNQGKVKSRVQLTSDEIKLLQTLVLTYLKQKIRTGLPDLLEAKLLVKLGRAQNRCAIIKPGGSSGGNKKEAA